MKKTAKLILLTIGLLLAPIPEQAQESVPSQPPEDAREAKATSATRITRPATDGRWFTRLGIVGAPYHSGATIAINGQLLPGGTAKVSNNFSTSFELGYNVTKNISASVFSGLPPKPHVTGQGTAASLNVLGKVRYGPTILSGNYHFPRIHGLRPYAGAGVAYAIIFKNVDASVTDLRVHNNWGYVVQGGAEYPINKKVDLFVDIKEVWLSVNAEGFLAGGVPVKARVKLDPTLVSVGIKLSLPFGRSKEK